MVPDFSSKSGSLKDLSFNKQALAEKATKAKEATEKLLQSDEMQSRFQEALQHRERTDDPAAPDSSSSSATHAVEQAQDSGRDGQASQASNPSTSQSSETDKEKLRQDASARVRDALADRLNSQMPASRSVLTGVLHHSAKLTL